MKLIQCTRRHASISPFTIAGICHIGTLLLSEHLSPTFESQTCSCFVQLRTPLKLLVHQIRVIKTMLCQDERSPELERTYNISHHFLYVLFTVPHLFALQCQLPTFSSIFISEIKCYIFL